MLQKVTIVYDCWHLIELSNWLCLQGDVVTVPQLETGTN